MGTASLASSVHLVCRPRENPDGSCAQTKSAIGGMSSPNFPAEFTNGCRVSLRKALSVRTPFSPASVPP